MIKCVEANSETAYEKFYWRKPFKCVECHYGCTKRTCLKQYMRTHTGEKHVKCTECNYTRTRAGSLKQYKNLGNSELDKLTQERNPKSVQNVINNAYYYIIAYWSKTLKMYRI